MSIYPGNPSLGDEVKRRIVTTYEQSVELAERGRRQEAILGCDFVLELDPQFAPARALKERLAAGDGGGAGAEAAAGPRPAEAPPEELIDDLFDLDGLDVFAPLDEPAAKPTASPPCDGLEASLRERLVARDFRGVLEQAGRERDLVAASPELARMAEIAQARLEAQPYVEGFLREAGMALRAGEAERAEAMLEKVRSLDPEHPLLLDLETSVRGTGPGAAVPAEAAREPPAQVPAEPEEGFAADAEILGGFELPDQDLSDEAPWGAESLEAQAAEDPFAIDAEDLAPPPELAPPWETPLQVSAPPRPVESRLEGDDRIGELLAEGQRAADAGDHQGAIDAWSRIFLIDVDHAEAGRRIEEARRLKAERERRVEEVFHEGLDALEHGDGETARRRFEQVLEMQPNHLAARDYLRQIESGEPVSVSRGPSPDETIAMGSLGTFDLSDLAGSRKRAPAGDLREEILVPPPPSEGGAAASAAASTPPGYGKAVTAQREPGRRSFLLVGGLVLVLVIAAGWWLFTNKDSFFPNSDTEEPAAGAPGAPGAAAAPGPIERAADLHERGQTAMALGLLRRIRPDDPRYEEAQELIARWEEPAAPAAEEPSGVPAETLERRERLLAAAQTAWRQGQNLLAADLYDRAGTIAALDEEARGQRAAVEGALAPIAAEVELFRQGEYDLVLPRLWRLYEENPGDRDVRRMLVDIYYNRGVRELQRGNASAAADEFEEALGVDPQDRDLQRHFLFAQTYERRAKDLLYRIYVKYLPRR